MQNIHLKLISNEVEKRNIDLLWDELAGHLYLNTQRLPFLKSFYYDLNPYFQFLFIEIICNNQDMNNLDFEFLKVKTDDLIQDIQALSIKFELIRDAKPELFKGVTSKKFARSLNEIARKRGFRQNIEEFSELKLSQEEFNELLQFMNIPDNLLSDLSNLLSTIHPYISRLLFEIAVKNTTAHIVNKKFGLHFPGATITYNYRSIFYLVSNYLNYQISLEILEQRFTKIISDNFKNSNSFSDQN